MYDFGKNVRASEIFQKSRGTRPQNHRSSQMTGKWTGLSPSRPNIYFTGPQPRDKPFGAGIFPVRRDSLPPKQLPGLGQLTGASFLVTDRSISHCFPISPRNSPLPSPPTHILTSLPSCPDNDLKDRNTNIKIKCI